MTEKEYRATLAKAEFGDVIRIRWRDSSRVDLGWDTVEEYISRLDKMMQSLEESAGYFVGSNDGFVMLAGSLTYWADTDKRHVVQAMAIPHEAIRSFDILAPGSSLDRAAPSR